LLDNRITFFATRDAAPSLQNLTPASSLENLTPSTMEVLSIRSVPVDSSNAATYLSK